jgi:hypothetical protein
VRGVVCVPVFIVREREIGERKREKNPTDKGGEKGKRRCTLVVLFEVEKVRDK